MSLKEINKVLLKETEQLMFDIPTPFDFKLTVAKPAGWHWATPKEVFENDTLWSGTYINDKPVGIKLSANRNSITLDVYSRSPLTPPELEKMQTDIMSGLGGDEDLNAFYDFAHSDKILSGVVKDLFGMRTGRLDDIFGRVILATTLQMAPLSRSMQMMGKILESYGTKISFDSKNVVLWPRPSDITQVTPDELRASAKLGYRAARLSKAAAFLESHPLSRKELDSLSEEDATKKLLEIPGIGKYSAGIILGRSSAPLDVWSVVFMSELLLKRTPEKPREEIDEVTNVMKKHWGEWSWMAFVYIANDLDKLLKIYHISRLS